MATRSIEVKNILTNFFDTGLATQIATYWDTWNNNKQVYVEEVQELRHYLYATSTRTTSNAVNEQLNSTTIPKLTQIYDNLHANYISTLFPKSDWAKFQASTTNSADIDAASVIEAYIKNKARKSRFRSEMSNILLDYIMWGTCFGTAEYIKEVGFDTLRDEEFIIYEGPSPVRISPMDICFDLTSKRWRDTPKIIRTIKTLSQIKNEIDSNPEENTGLQKALDRRLELRSVLAGTKPEDWRKASNVTVDGFGNLYDYINSDYVEILELVGSVYDVAENKLLPESNIKVMDRSYVFHNEEVPLQYKGSLIAMASWRKRPDNLWGMSPLANLVGMQYRLDHLENSKADLLDLIAFPPIVVEGDVNEFKWGPGEEIHIDEIDRGRVSLLKVQTELNAVMTEMSHIEQRMEEYAGAPREAMGIRTPGEKTAFEVQRLESAAGRIFQEKTTNFEIEFLEPLLNLMLNKAIHNLSGEDVIRITDDDIGAEKILKIKASDLNARGVIHPIGARHFSEQANLIQNLSTLSGTNLWAAVSKHLNDKQLSKLIEDILNLDRFDLFSDNAALFGQAETERLSNTLQKDLAAENTIPDSGVPGDDVGSPLPQ